MQLVFLHSIVARLVPSFSNFLLAILTHYDIHLIHLQSNSITILSIFAFFYSLRCTVPGEISGSVSFHLEPSAAGSLIPMSVLRKVEDFRQRWVLVDTCLFEPLYQLPDEMSVKTKEWAREPLRGSCM